jgi:peptide/nickel transport system substrate-binding protein
MRATAMTSVAVIALVALAGCGGGGGGGAKEKALVDGATFNYALGFDPGNLDPATNEAQTGTTIFHFAYDSVVVIDQKGNPQPSLATKWTVSPRKVTLTIRKGVTCADGSAVTASVIAQDLEHLKDPKVQNATLNTLDYKAKAAGDTVTITYGAPTGFPLQALASVPIVCGKGLKDRSMLARGTSGSGPYVMTQAVPNDHYTFQLRKGYRWGPNGASTDVRGLPARVVMKVIPSESTTANLLLNGQIDGAIVNGPDKKRLEAAKLRSAVVSRAPLDTYFHVGSGHPTADAAVRRALMMALDRAALAKVEDGEVADGLTLNATNPCPRLAPDAAPGHDPATAGQLLDEAGWTKGPDGVRAKDGKRLSLSVLSIDRSDAQNTAAVELITKAWKAMGVQVKQRTLAGNAALQAMGQGSFDVVPLLSINVNVPPQMQPFVSGPTPPNGQNMGHIDDAQYEASAAKGLAAGSQADACAAWKAADEALVRNAEVVPLVAGDIVEWSGRRATFSNDANDIMPTSIRMHAG